MLRQFPNISSWRERDVMIAPRETKTIDYLDTNPNQFVIINPNQAILKVGISNIPRPDNYERIIEYNTTETFGRPSGTSKLYILNDSDLHISIKVFSINEPFNIEILKNMNVNLSDYVIESNSEISGVKAGVVLPVRMDETNGEKFTDMQTALNDLVNPSPLAGTTNLYALLKVLESIRDKEMTLNGDGITINGVATDMTATNGKLGDINQILNQIKTLHDTYYGTVAESTALVAGLLNAIIPLVLNTNTEYEPTPIYLNNSNAFEHTATTENHIVHFSWLFNDGGDTDVYINDTVVFTMLDGENFSDMNFKLSKGDVIRFESENPSYRIKYWTIPV